MTLRPIVITLNIVKVMAAYTSETELKAREHQRQVCVQRIGIRIRLKIKVTSDSRSPPSFCPVLSTLQI